jgi:hypothetical protein
MTSDSALRVTRSKWHLAGAVALLAVVGVLRAQEPAAPAPAPPASTPAAPPATGKSPAEPAATSKPATGTPGRTQDRFEPTEKVRADFDVSFPIDI